MNDTSQEPVSNKPRSPPLALPIEVGMPMVVIDDGSAGTIVGITAAYCIYRLEHRITLAVAPWREIAISNIVPQRQLLPTAIDDLDRANARAAVLRELLAMRQFGLTSIQQAALNELTVQLCGDSVGEQR